MNRILPATTFIHFDFQVVEVASLDFGPTMEDLTVALHLPLPFGAEER
jgi:hypothetical protein